MYLVLGASGQLGSRVARRLLDAGHAVRAQSREPEMNLGELVAAGAEPVKGDLREDGWVDDAVQGVTHVLIATQGLFPPSRTNHAGTVDEPGSRMVIDSAKRAGVDHVVFMSSPLHEPEIPVRFIQVKKLTEDYLQSSGLGYTIIRAPVFTEVHGLAMLGNSLREKGEVQFFGRGETLHRWISVEDVADYVVKAFDEPGDRNAIRVIGGPDVMSRAQVLEIIERHESKRAKRKHLPLTMMRVMRVLTKPVNPGLSDLISFAITEETKPDHPGFAPKNLDWEGPTTVEDVVSHWAGTHAPEPIAAN